jgi:hypothetical protein
MLILHTLDQGDSGGVWVVYRWLAGLWHTCEVYSYAPHGSSAGEQFKIYIQTALPVDENASGFVSKQP